MTLASQITRYEFEVDDDNPAGGDALLPFGAYDFAWPAAAKGDLAALSLAYRIDTEGLNWLDYVLPYVEYSGLYKDDRRFNDSEMFVLGAAWASGGWYIYTDYARSNGNFFVGNVGDDYGNLFSGVGDLGANGNNRWNYRVNINMGYYF